MIADTDLEILKAAKETAADRVKGDPSRENLSALEKASRMLSEYLEGDKEPVFDNLLRVKEHLNRLGYKVGKSKIYKDRKAGFIRIEADGTVKESSVKAYIRKANLENLTEKAAADQGPSVLTQKAEKEIEKLEEQISKLRREREIMEGRYMDRAEVEMELAGKCAALEAGIRNLFHIRLPDWVETANSVGMHAAMDAAHKDLSSQFNDFANMGEFEVVFN